jgi:hypothetical protein
VEKYFEILKLQKNCSPMLHKDPMLPIEATLPTLPNEVAGQPQGDAVPDAIPAANMSRVRHSSIEYQLMPKVHKNNKEQKYVTPERCDDENFVKEVSCLLAKL